MPTRKGRLSKPVRHYHRPRAYRMAPARRHKMAVRPDNEEGRLLVSNIGPNINLDAINEVLALFGNVGKIQIHQNVDLSLTEVHRYLWRRSYRSHRETQVFSDFMQVLENCFENYGQKR